MKSEPERDICAEHDWQHLFDQPTEPEHVREHMAYGYADFMTCTKCGAVCMVDGPGARAIHLLSPTSAESKRRHAGLWNAKTSAPLTAQPVAS